MRASAIGVICAGVLVACSKSEPPQPPASVSATPTAAPLSAGIDREQFDPSVRPQDDFYRHVNGIWLKNNPVPSDKSNYGSFTRLADEAEAQLRTIIEESASKKDRAPGSDEQKVGDYYAAFMDEARVEKLGCITITPGDWPMPVASMKTGQSKFGISSPSASKLCLL